MTQTEYEQSRFYEEIISYVNEHDEGLSLYDLADAFKHLEYDEFYYSMGKAERTSKIKVVGFNVYPRGKKKSKPGPKKKRAKLTAEDVKDIRRRLELGQKRVYLAKLFRVTEGTITNIKYGKTWSDVQ